jgi:FMN reductase (NADPH)
MTTQTIEQIHRHGSVRSYKPDPVPREWVESIVAAGQRSSTSSNLQLYSVVAVTDADLRGQLSLLCGDQDHIRQAPVFMAWCADRSRLDRVCALRGYTQVTDSMENFLVAAVDVAILMQTAALAAESLGLGICYIGGIRTNAAQVIELLNLPHHVVPISGMTLGWPDVQPPIRPRLATEAILHWERYDTAGEADLMRAYDQAMIETGIYAGRQVPVPGSDEEMEEYGWMEHCARRVSGPMRPDLGQVIRDQGFALE